MINPKSIIVATNGPELVETALAYEPETMIVVGAMPTAPIPGVPYLDEPQRLNGEFDLLLSDVDKITGLTILVQNFGVIGYACMSCLVIQDSLDMGRLGFSHAGNLHGMLLWSKVEEKPDGTPSPRRKVKKPISKRIRRPPRPIPPIDLLPCIHRGGRRGVMFDGQNQHEVRDCAKHMTCWLSMCEKCQDRQE